MRRNYTSFPTKPVYRIEYVFTIYKYKACMWYQTSFCLDKQLHTVMRLFVTATASVKYLPLIKCVTHQFVLINLCENAIWVFNPFKIPISAVALVLHIINLMEFSVWTGKIMDQGIYPLKYGGFNWIGNLYLLLYFGSV